MNYKIFFQNYLKYFFYFYNHLGYRVFVFLFISLLVGLFDGIGLALFIPLLKLIVSDTTSSENPQELDFMSDFLLNNLGLSLSLLNISVLIFSFFCLKGIAQFFETYIRVLYQQYFIRKIRISNINSLNRFDYKNFLQIDFGRIQNTFSGEVGRVNSAYVNYFKAIQYCVLVLVYMLMALASNWKFTIIALLGGLILTGIYKYLYRRTKYFSKKFTEESHIFQNLMIQNVYLFKYLKATGLNFIYANKLKDNIYGMENTQKKLGLVSAILGGVKEPLTILLVFCAIYINMLLFGETVEVIILSLILLYRAIVFFMAFQEQWNSFLGFSGSLENIRNFETELIAGEDKHGSQYFIEFEEKMILKNVSFEFQSGYKILKNINFEIQKNETIAIVGESGSGKSTLMNILTGLLRPSEGNYFIDNMPIGELNLDSFKKHIGYIVQDATIFNDTIYNNISFWAPKTKENYQRFLKAAEQAAILDFINNLPSTEETLLGANGLNISGGQRQRISIARELFKEVSFLFMDEATSSLDGETEAAIQENIQNLKGHYTILIIAHRLSTIRNADRIILMKEGEILETGTFNQLIKSSKEFQLMVSHQNL